MLPSTNRHVTRPLKQSDPIADTPTAPMPVIHQRRSSTRTTGQLEHKVTTTDTLPDRMSPITRQLPVQGRVTTKLPIRIPATKKYIRVKVSPTKPERMPKRPLVLASVLISSIATLLFALAYVSPLGVGEHPEGLTQAITDYFATGVTNPFTPSQRIPTPTPTPALLTNEGSCNQPEMGLWGTCATAVTESGVMGTGQMERPINGAVITQAYGLPEYQSWCVCVRPHTGIDLAAPHGAPVMAVDSGQVIWVGWDWSGLGWAVKVNHGKYIATVYGHLARYIVEVGQNVTKGEVIAYEGSTGASTGPHLHLMVVVNNRWQDPINYITLP